MDCISSFTKYLKRNILRPVLHLGNEQYCKAVYKFFESCNLREDAEIIKRDLVLGTTYLGKYIVSFMKGIEKFDIRDSSETITNESISQSLELNPKYHFVIIDGIDFHSLWYILKKENMAFMLEGLNHMYAYARQIVMASKDADLEHILPLCIEFEDRMSGRARIAQSVIENSIINNDAVTEKVSAIRTSEMSVNKVTKIMEKSGLDDVDLSIESLLMENEKVREVSNGIQKYFGKQLGKGNMTNDDLLNIFTSVLKESKTNSENNGGNAELTNSLNTFISQIESNINMDQPGARKLLTEIEKIKYPASQDRSRDDTIRVYKNKLRALRNTRNSRAKK